MKRSFCAGWILVLVLAGSAHAQRTEFFSLAGSGSACREIEAGGAGQPFDCPGKPYTIFMGYVAWGPLRYVGPITIEVHALRNNPRIPFYVEVAPTDGRTVDRYCDGPASVVMIVRGVTDCRDEAETTGPLDLEAGGLISYGEPYFIRAQFFSDPRVEIGSPSLGWIHVFPSPTSIEAKTWSLVKNLYR